MNCTIEKDMKVVSYLQLDGIEGECEDSLHKGWIKCRSVSFGVLNNKSVLTLHNSFNAPQREHSDIYISKLCDLSTPLLLERCSMGKVLSKAKLEFFSVPPKGDSVKFFTVDLDNILISSVSSELKDEVMNETFSLKYSSVKWRYIIAGKGNVAGGWDIGENRRI